ncbi:MAG: DUF952 domain-containing protein [Hyphomonadaceae bacterium]
MGQKSNSRVYRIATAAAWRRAQAAGVYTGGADDVRDGFMHLSAGPQVAETLRRHYRGVNDLLLLTVDADAIPLVWEPSRGGALFPHLYGDLPLSAVIEVTPLARGADGEAAPPDLPA